MCAIISGLKTFRRHAGSTQEFALLAITFHLLTFVPDMVCSYMALLLQHNIIYK